MRLILKFILPFSYLFLLLPVLFSCVTERKCSEKFPPQIISKDSIVYYTDTVEIVTTDTIFYKIEPDTVFDTKYVYIDRKTGLTYTDTSRLENKFSVSTAGVMYGKLFHELIQKDSVIVLTFDQYHYFIKSVQERYKSETKIVKEKYTPKFIKIMAWVGGVCLFILVIIILINLIPQLRFLKKLM